MSRHIHVNLLSTILFYDLFLLNSVFVTDSQSLLCYNGTFTHKWYGEDPLLYKGLFTPTRKDMARLRCALTIPCAGEIQMSVKLCWIILIFTYEVASLLCYNCTCTHRDRKNCGGDFTPAGQPFINDRQLLVNCTGDGAMCFVRSWAARARYAWMVQRGCYQTNKDDPIPRAMTTPTRSMSCRNERYAEAEYKVCFCQADWCNSTPLVRVESFVLVTICVVVNLSVI